jgi:hypothetical protein
MGIGAALAMTRRRGEEAVAELAAIPDSPTLKAADEAMMCLECTDGDDGARQVPAKIAWMAEQYRGGQHRLDLAYASPAELLAFCDAVEMEAWGWGVGVGWPGPEPARNECWTVCPSRA